MGIHILIYIIYFILLSILIFKFTKNLDLKINPLAWIFAYIFKLLIGSLYGWYFKDLTPTADSWLYFHHGINILNQRIPIANSGIQRNLNILDSDSYFNLYRYLFMDYFSAFLSILSGKSYFINLIFYNFLVLLGLIKLYQYILKIDNQNYFTYFIVLCYFPPFVFWTSGYHRDGLCIATLGVYLFNFHNYIRARQSKSLIFSVIAIGFMLFLRSFWGFSAVVMGILWLASSKFTKFKPYHIFSLGTLILSILFAISAFGPPSLNFAQSLVDKQHAFLELLGDSELPITKLSPDLETYIRGLLDGFNHLTLRPYPTEIGSSPLYLLALLENCFVWALMAIVIYFSISKRKFNLLSKPENNALLFLIIVNYAVIGLTVPFLGAIVRYKAPFEMLLILFLIQFIPPEFLRKFIPTRFRINN